MPEHPVFPLVNDQPNPRAVRVESITVVPNAQSITVSKLVEDMMSRKQMSWLRSLYILAEFRISKSKIRTCHVD